MQLVINSANINTFFVKVTIDIYNRKVIFDTSGTTYQGGGSGLIKGISFSMIDQAGLELANGGINFVTPQIVGPVTNLNNIWTLDLSSVSFAFLFQQYQITAAIQDSNGTIYTTIPVFKTLYQPNNLNAAGYVPGIFQITPDTINSVLTVKELTALVYNSLAPVSTTKSGTLNYPTGTIAAVPFTSTPFSNNVIYTGQYQINCTTVSVYNLQDDVYVNVTYLTANVFPVTVANKIADLLCCISQIQATAKSHCDDAIGENARQQLQDIAPYMLVGIAKETSGQDATNEANYIRKYLACDCGSSSLSQSQFTPINPAVTSIVLQGVGGTNILSPTITGNTQTYNIQSSIYQVAKGNTGDLAFSISESTTTPNVVQYLITFNYDTFAGSILTAIAADPSLVAQLNSLITSALFNPAGLNGKCVINLTTSNYSLNKTITNATTISNVVINGTNYAAPSNLSANNAVAVAAWLNSLTLGVFSATLNGNVLSILSLNNTNTLSTLSFVNPNVNIQFQNTNATLVQVLQAIINYVCALTDSQVALGTALSLCTFDYNGNIITTPFNTTQGSFNSGISSAICNIASRINTLTGFTCATLQAIFNDSPNAVFNIATDRILAFIGGNCVTMTAKQLVLAVLAEIPSDAQSLAAFCAINCSTPATCPDVSNTNLSATGISSIGLFGLTWNGSTTASQTVTVKYRITGSSIYTVATGALGVLPNGNLSGSSPFNISGLTANTQYDILVINNCGGTGFVKQVTTPATSVSSGTFLLSNASYTICGAVPVTLYSSVPFASGVTMYNDAGLSMPVTGFVYIASQSSGHVFGLNTSTGVVGSDTGLLCSAGVAGTYLLANSSASVCSASSATKYTNGAFTPGGVLYNDSSLSSPVTGFTFVVNTATNVIYNLNSTTGVIGASTGTNCTGAATLTFSFVNAGGSFLQFEANLNRAIDGTVNIQRVFADGFSDSMCGVAVSSAQKNTTMTIAIGSTGVGSPPDASPPPTGTWNTAIMSKVYNVVVNGSALVNGSTIMIGSYVVTLVIPACA